MPTKNNFYLRDQAFIQDAASSLSNKSKRSLSETKSENTIDAYESDWNDFCDWCRFKHQTAFPATPETIINYINDLADNARISTVRRRVSAISENFNAAGLYDSNPCRSWIVRESLIGIGRQIGGIQKGKTPVYWEDLERIVSLLDMDKPADLRDKAILLIGFMGAFRRSELASLQKSNIAYFPKGIVITIPHSKTDQEGTGQKIGIPYIKDKNMCAVTALEQWLAKSGIHEGPLFRRILKNGTVSASQISDKSINLIVKQHVAQIGLPPENYGGHSLRHGFATYAALNGIEERLIMKQTRHRSVEMVRRYIDEADLFVNNPVSMMFDK